MSEDNIKSKDDYMYANQFQWFTGVIEDITDPEQRGRYRVRCFGYHTELKDYLPTTALPWAHVMMPVTSAAQCGVGESATGLLRGTWVVGFFRDGATAQDPVIMGSLPSITPTVDYGFGYSDPVFQYPYASKIKQQDIPEEAISKGGKYKKSFSYKKKEDHRKLTPVPIAFDGVWKLPPVPSIIRVEYPKNHVKAWERKVILLPVVEPISDVTGILNKDIDKVEFFEGGVGVDPAKKMHVQEFDVTPGWERISTMHRTGTYKEWTPVGDDTTVIVGKEYRIIVKDQHINVKGSCTLTVEGNLHTLVLGDEYRHIKGNLIEQIDGSKTTTVLGNVTRNHAMNEMKKVGMNEANTVEMNKVEKTELNEAEKVGAFRQALIKIDDMVAAFNNKVDTVAGNAEEYVQGKVNQAVKGIKSLFVGEDKKKQVMGDEVERVVKNVDYTNLLDRNHGCAGTAIYIGKASCTTGADGPSSQQGNPTSFNQSPYIGTP